MIFGGVFANTGEDAAKNPEKPAIICGDDVVSYRVLDGSTDALAGWLLDKGLGIGDRIAIHSCNSAEVVKLYFACFKAGLEVGVVGLPDAVHGQRVVAFVTLRDGHSAGERELQDWARSRIADFNTPERIVFRSQLPKGLTGKVDRRALLMWTFPVCYSARASLAPDSSTN